MAITKIGVYRNPPEDMTDFEAISDLLMAYARDLGGQGMILTEWTNTDEWPKLAMGSYIFHGGASYLVDTEDYDIGSPGNGTYYLRIKASGETLAVSWITSLSGYAWNPIYNGLYHADQSQILPYQLVVAGAVREKWKITNLAQGGGFIRSNWQGAVRMESVNTGQGDFKIGQNLRPTDNVEFAKGLFTLLNTGHGENELYPMNQAVKTDSDVAHNKMIAATHLGVSSYTSRSVAAKNALSGQDLSTTLSALNVGEMCRFTFGAQGAVSVGSSESGSITYYMPSGNLFLVVMLSGSMNGGSISANVSAGGRAFMKIQGDDKAARITNGSVFLVWRIA